MKLASNGLGDFKFRERGYYFKHRMKKAELVCVDGIWHLIEEMVPHTRSSDGFLEWKIKRVVLRLVDKRCSRRRTTGSPYGLSLKICAHCEPYVQGIHGTARHCPPIQYESPAPT